MRALFALAVVLVTTSAYAQLDYSQWRTDEWSRRTAMPGLIWGSEIAIEIQPCCDANRNPNDEHSKELTIAPGKVSRDGLALKLKLDGGKTLKIIDCNDENRCGTDTFRVHRLVAWWPKFGYYVVSVGLYEGEFAFLVREADGLLIRVAAPPVLSPNEGYAIAWDPSVLNGFTMELLDMKPNPPKIYAVTNEITCPGRSEAARPGPNPTWISNTQIAFDDSDFSVMNSPRFRMTLTILAELNLLWRCQL